MRHPLLPLLLLAAPAALAASSPAASAPTCRPVQLAGSVGSATGAAGTIMLAVVLRNSSGSRCTLRGYPALRLYRRHQLLPTTVVHGGLAVLNRPVRTIVLRPGGRATVLVAYSDVPRGSRPCSVATSLQVLAHGTNAGVAVTVHALACGGRLRVSPLLQGVVQAP